MSRPGHVAGYVNVASSGEWATLLRSRQRSRDLKERDQQVLKQVDACKLGTGRFANLSQSLARRQFSWREGFGNERGLQSD